MFAHHIVSDAYGRRRPGQQPRLLDAVSEGWPLCGVGHEQIGWQVSALQCCVLVRQHRNAHGACRVHTIVDTMRPVRIEVDQATVVAQQRGDVLVMHLPHERNPG